MRRLNFAVLAFSAFAGLLAACDGNDAVDPLGPGKSAAARTSTSELGRPIIDSALSYSETRIDVRWTDNSTRETGFEIHRSVTGATGVFTLVGSTAADVVLYEDVGVDARVENCYKARALKVSGNKTSYSTFSNVVCGPFRPAAPNAPSDVTAAAASEDLVNVGWRDNSDNETRFYVERAGALTVVTGANVQSYADGTVMPAAEYCYTLRAVNALVIGTSTLFGYSSRTEPVCVTTPPESAPPPSAYVVAAKPYGSNMSELSVQWTDSSTPPAFRTYRSTDGAVTWTRITPSGGPSIFYDSPVASEQLVCYRVIAYNTAGDAEPSSAACTTPPAGPFNLASTAVNTDTLELTWSDNSGVEDGYRLYIVYEQYSPDNAGYQEWGAVVAELPPNATSTRAVREADDEYTTIYYYVVATNDGGESASSGWVSASVPTN